MNRHPSAFGSYGYRLSSVRTRRTPGGVAAWHGTLLGYPVAALVHGGRFSTKWNSIINWG